MLFSLKDLQLCVFNLFRTKVNLAATNVSRSTDEVTVSTISAAPQRRSENGAEIKMNENEMRLRTERRCEGQRE